MNKKLISPFPYFGGKGAIASTVWQLLGDVRHYIEPFFGSGAVLLQRPDYDATRHVELVNDADGHICNLWRSLQFAPDETARWCDWPVNHADLMARKKELNLNTEDLLRKLSEDTGYDDVKLAGYWIWAASCWIGSGMICPGQIPNLSNAGMGVHKLGQIPHLSDAGKGVHKLGGIPHIGKTGIGVHKLSQRPHLSDAGAKVTDPYNVNIYTWFRQLSERLRYVRVVCGDWTRVCGGNWQDKMGTVGIFFDPPYSDKAGRAKELYAVESLSVAHDVREWCIERGKIESYRIVLARYEGEHEALLDHGWICHHWKTGGGYSKLGKKEKNDNRKKEVLWASPYCLKTKLF